MADLKMADFKTANLKKDHENGRYSFNHIVDKKVLRIFDRKDLFDLNLMIKIHSQL